MKKRILSLALVVVMIAIMLSSFTMAYFTDAETETNVLTIGEIDINLNERTKNADGELVPFTEEDAVPLLPLPNDEGITSYNKIVDVKNDGENDAYIRTIVAIESWTLPGYEDEQEGQETFVTVFHNSYSNQVVETKYNPMVINGKKYIVLVYDQASEDPIAAGESVQSMQSLWLDTSVTQEMMAALEGKLDVLVLAQGIQADGFDSYEEAMASFGEINSENLSKWFGNADDAVIND